MGVRTNEKAVTMIKYLQQSSIKSRFKSVGFNISNKGDQQKEEIKKLNIRTVSYMN